MQALSQLSYGPTSEGREFWGTSCAKSNELAAAAARAHQPNAAAASEAAFAANENQYASDSRQSRRNFLQLTINNDTYLHEFIGLASTGLYLA